MIQFAESIDTLLIGVVRSWEQERWAVSRKKGETLVPLPRVREASKYCDTPYGFAAGSGTNSWPRLVVQVLEGVNGNSVGVGKLCYAFQVVESGMWVSRPHSWPIGRGFRGRILRLRWRYISETPKVLCCLMLSYFAT